MADRAEDHYENIADDYDEIWAHRPEYVSWMSKHCATRLRMQPGKQVADIGVGTGLFLGRLAENAEPDTPILCVDPSRPMLNHLPGDPRLQPIQAAAEDVAAGRVELPYEKLDGILIKEVIHHVTDLPGTMQGLADLLVPGGRMLVVTLPPRLEYPLFQAALDRFAANHPEPDMIAQTMRDAGLESSLTYEEYAISVDRDHYIELVGRRWMSVLYTFSDEELAAGLQKMRERHPEPELHFNDRFAFVLGVGPER